MHCVSVCVISIKTFNIDDLKSIELVKSEYYFLKKFKSLPQIAWKFNLYSSSSSSRGEEDKLHINTTYYLNQIMIREAPSCFLVVRFSCSKIIEYQNHSTTIEHLISTASDAFHVSVFSISGIKRI